MIEKNNLQNKEPFINKVICDDCLKIMKTLPDKCIDLVLTDPPYEFISKTPSWWWIYKEENKKHLIELDNTFWMSFKPKEFLQEIKRLCKLFNAYIWTNKSLLKEYITFADDNWYKREIIIWIKDNPIPAFNGKYMNDKEYCIYIKESCIYIKESWATFNTIKWEYSKYFTWYKNSIWNSEFEHPTVKPQFMINRQLEISSNKWDIILDCFAWSWTTGGACKELWRNYILVEKEPKYIEIINKRLDNTTISLFH